MSFTGKVLKDYCVDTNDYNYLKGQIVRVIELNEFKNSYAVYSDLDGYNSIDWIPKEIIQRL